MTRWFIIIAVLFIATGCDEFGRNAECRRVEKAIEAMKEPDPLRQLRAFESMEEMTAVETLLMIQVIDAINEGSKRGPYLLCMDMNR